MRLATCSPPPAVVRHRAMAAHQNLQSASAHRAAAEHTQRLLDVVHWVGQILAPPAVALVCKKGGIETAYCRVRWRTHTDGSGTGQASKSARGSACKVDPNFDSHVEDSAPRLGAVGLGRLEGVAHSRASTSTALSEGLEQWQDIQGCWGSPKGLFGNQQ